jgi:molybdopterin molybdotransferase
MVNEISWQDARTLAVRSVVPAGATHLGLSAAIGRVLAEDLVAQIDLPIAPTAMMDGWAVAGEGPWKIVGEITAGQSQTAIAPNTAYAVNTGAHIPANTRFVLPLELGTVDDNDCVHTDAHLPAAKHVRPIGDELVKGDVIAVRGSLLTPVRAGLAASAGLEIAKVVHQPLVEIITTGDEVIHSGVPTIGQIRDSLGMQIPSWLQHLGAQCISVTHVGDDEEQLTHALKNSIGQIVVSTGGTSKGTADHLQAAIRNVGGELLIAGIAMRPGHPTILATRANGQLIVGLPGNPLAAVVGFMTLVAPALLGITGSPLPNLARAKFGDLPAEKPGRGKPVSESTTRIYPVSVTNGIASPTQFRGSAMLRGLAGATHLGVVTSQDDEVQLLELPWRTN